MTVPEAVAAQLDALQALLFVTVPTANTPLYATARAAGDSPAAARQANQQARDAVSALDQAITAAFTAPTPPPTSGDPSPAPTTPVATTGAAAFSSCTYTSWEGAQAVATLEGTIGHAFDQVMDFGDGTTYDTIAESAPQICSYWASQHRRLVYGLPMVANGGSFADVTSGANDHAWTATAQALVANGYADTEVRIGWEFNGGWMPWAANGKTAEFIAAYQHIVTTMRATAPQLCFVWNPTRSDMGVGDLADYWPGDAYVDRVTLDVYDQEWQTYPGEPAEWDQICQQPYGLDWLVAFAAEHGKQLGISEAGILGQTASDPTPAAAFTRTGVEVDGGDDGAFWTAITAWAATHQAFLCVWSNGNCALTPTTAPDSIAALKAATWG